MKNKLLFVLILLIPLNVYAIEQVETVDTKERGITINLFDYDADDKGSNNAANTISQEKINSISPLKFLGHGSELDEGVDENFFSGENTVKQGIVKNTLNANQFPKLYNNEDLDILFNSQTNDYKRVYSDLNGLFVLDAEGYYYFSSNDYYAYLDTSTQTKNFKLFTPTYKVYESFKTDEYYEEHGKNKNVGFFPFDTYNSDKTNLEPTMDLQEDGIEGYNHHFGLTMDAAFQYPKDGKIYNKDMIFNFSGDDDIWIFIDNVLVLDLGGIHGATNGSINFATGEVKVDNAIPLAGGASANGATNTIENIFRNAGRNFDTTYASLHNIKVFYLERGGIYSNMAIKTNLFKVTGEVSKEQLDEYSGIEDETPDTNQENTTIEENKTEKITNPKTGSTAIVTVFIVLVISIVLHIFIKRLYKDII